MLPNATLPTTLPFIPGSVDTAASNPPPSISNVLIRDWDFGSIPGPNSGDLISNVPDNTFYADMTQETASKQPVLKQAVIGNKTFWYGLFDGVDDYLLAGANDTYAAVTVIAIASLHSAVTTLRSGLVSVAKPTDTDYHAGGFALTANAQSSGSVWKDFGLTCSLFTSIDTPFTFSSIASFGDWKVLIGQFSNTGGAAWDSGELLGTVTETSGTVFDLHTWLGARKSSTVTGFGPVAIARILMYDGVLSSNDRSKIDSWVQDNYGILVSDYTSSTVTTSFDLEWGVVGRVSLAPQFVFGINQKVVVSPQLEWGVASGVRVIVTPQLEWNVLHYLQKTFTPEWNTDAVTSRVTINPKLIWNTREQFLIETQLKWVVLQQVAKSLNAQWQVRAFIELQYQLNWGVRNLINTTPNLKWAVSVIEGLLSIFEWGVAQTFSKTHEFDWGLTSRVPVGITFEWQTIGRIINAPLFAWQVRAVSTWTDENVESTSYADVAKPSTDFAELSEPTDHWNEL